jgi:hypothetical protein
MGSVAGEVEGKRKGASPLRQNHSIAMAVSLPSLLF